VFGNPNVFFDVYQGDTKIRQCECFMASGDTDFNNNNLPYNSYITNKQPDGNWYCLVGIDPPMSPYSFLISTEIVSPVGGTQTFNIYTFGAPGTLAFYNIKFGLTHTPPGDGCYIQIVKPDGRVTYKSNYPFWGTFPIIANPGSPIDNIIKDYPVLDCEIGDKMQIILTASGTNQVGLTLKELDMTYH
jgi:hypothetical protein